MEAKEIEKVLLKVDDFELRQSKARAKEAEKDLNSFIKLVEGELKRKLSPDEAIAVKDDALNWLESSLNFPLPNAPEKMRYDALGIDIWIIQQAWEKRTWGADRRGREWEFTIEGDVFKLKEDQSRYASHFKYATPKQLEILEQTETLADALNIGAKQGLNVLRTSGGNSIAPMYKLKDFFPVILYDDKKGEFVPNLERIAHIK